MNLKSTLIAIIITILTISSAQANEEKLYTKKKYPYNLLLKKTDSVKIIYTESKNKINCKVEINWKGESITSKESRISKVKFVEEPLASCLARDKAKSILAKTFE
jgi:hypothetical protein